MRTIPIALQSHLDSGSTTLARLWKVTRMDGEVFGFTDHDQAITFAGTTYEARSGFDASAMKAAGDLSVDNLEAGGLLDSAGITAQDLEAGLWDDASIEVREVNWRDLSMGSILLLHGSLGQIVKDGLRYRAELRGLTHRLSANIGRSLYPTCDAVPGEARCGIDLNSDPDYKVTTTAATVASSSAFTVAGITQPDGWFDFGLLEILSGAAQGLRADIKQQVGGAFTLQLPLPLTLAPGDSIRLTVGCARTKEVCKAKFNNLLNFRGFSFVPGPDRVGLFGGQT